MSVKMIDQYTVLQVQDRGKYGYSLVEGWMNQNGEFKPNFCKREFKKGSGEKATPVAVKLGDKAKVLEIAEWLRREIIGEKIESTHDEEPF